MQLFTLSITDLTTFESVPHEQCEKEDLFKIGNHFARVMFAANPGFCRRNLRRSRNSVGDATRHPAIESP